MATSKPLNWQISDVVQWYKKRELVINDNFQRHAVWTPQAKTFLIDTILNELPLPKIYIRTIIDPKKQASIREIVDGQQRIRAIVEFANNEFALSRRSEKFHGHKYESLDEESKEKFLGYLLTIEQLLNASDDDVIDIFARLNSYTVNLNAAEKRHAEFQTEFKFSVRYTSQVYRPFIEKYGIFSVKKRFRMADDEFFAEVYKTLIEGVSDGGAPRLKALYKSQDDDEFNERKSHAYQRKIADGIEFLESTLDGILKGHLGKPYHLLMILAAYFHHKFGIPQGQIETMPVRKSLASVEVIRRRLSQLELALESDDPPKRFLKFVEASSSSTHRISSRRERFLVLCDLLGE